MRRKGEVRRFELRNLTDTMPDAILDYSNCSRVSPGHQAYSETRHSTLPESAIKIT